MKIKNKIAKKMITSFLRFYTYNELPGWGIFYKNLVGGYENDDYWKDSKPQWVRGKYHGYEIKLDISTWPQRLTYFLGRYYDLPSQLLLMKILKPGDTFCDIGGNIGEISYLASNLVGPKGHVDTFEPNPKLVSYINEMIAHNQIKNTKVHDCALSDKEETLTLTIPRVNPGEATLAPSKYADDSVEKVQVPVFPGDKIIKNRDRLTVIKMDVEGFEYRAISGMSELLSSLKPCVIMEVNTAHLENAGTSYIEVFEKMEQLGYKCNTYTPKGKFRKKLLMNEVSVDTFLDSGSQDFLWIHSEKIRDTMTDIQKG
jgi:FkbM family methyltransferase